MTHVIRQDMVWFNEQDMHVHCIYDTIHKWRSSKYQFCKSLVWPEGGLNAHCTALEASIVNHYTIDVVNVLNFESWGKLTSTCSAYNYQNLLLEFLIVLIFFLFTHTYKSTKLLQ